MGVRKNCKILIKIIISAGCILLCSYQIYIVGLLYFSYPTTVDIRIGRSLDIHLPGITICSEISTTVLIDKLSEYQPNLVEVFAGKTQNDISLLLRKKSYRDLLEQPLRRLPIHIQHKNTVSWNQFFERCELPTPIGYQKGLTYNYQKINCSAISKIVETISYERKCFTLFYNNEENYNPNHYKINRDTASNLKYLVWLRINRDYLYNGLIYVHPPKVFHQYSEGNNVMQINQNRDQFIGISFSRQTTHLLPPPYATQCKNYTELGFTSREHCLAQCKIDEYLKKDGWPGDMFATNNITYSFSKLWINSMSPSGHLEEGLTLFDKCSEKCSDFDSCENVFYDLKQLRAVERDEEDLNETKFMTIGILPPKSVDITSHHMPKLQAIELAIYVGGLIGMYLGLSVVSIFVTVFTFITFTSKPWKPSIDKNKINGKQNTDQEIELRQKPYRVQDFNNQNNNNYYYTNPLMRRPYSEPLVDLRPRPRLPGILQFMFDS